MENLSLGRNINECLVHGELVLRTGHKRMSCAWRTCPEDRTQMSVLWMENLHRGQDITECLVHGELGIMTGHKRMSCAWRTCTEDRT